MCKDIEVVSDQLQTIKLGSMTMTIPNNEIAAALAKAQGAITNAKKTSNNPFFNRKYAALDEVWDVCRKPLSDNGLAFSQWPSAVSTGETFKWWDKDGKMKEAPGAIITITSLLEHSSGQFKCSEYSLPAVWDAQKEGSAITYARRYAMMSILGIAPEDDDGNEASSQNDPSNQKPTQQQPQQRPRQQQTQKPAETSQKPAQQAATQAQPAAQAQAAQKTQTPAQATAQQTQTSAAQNPIQIPCKHCGKDITGKSIVINGATISLREHTVKKFGFTLCEECLVRAELVDKGLPAAQTQQIPPEGNQQQGFPHCKKCNAEIVGYYKSGMSKAEYIKKALGDYYCEKCAKIEKARQDEEAKANVLPQQTQQAA